MVRDAKSFNSFTTPGNTTLAEAKTPLARIASAETLQRASAMKQQQMTSSKFPIGGKRVVNGTPLRRDTSDEVPTKVELKSLRGVVASKQEAFLIEDLLYVLLVCFFFKMVYSQRIFFNTKHSVQGMNGEYIQLRKSTKLNGTESFDYFIEKNIGAFI